MKIQELRQMNAKKLREALKKMRHALAVNRFHLQTGQAKSTAEVKKQKKTIAQILTLLNSNQSA